ncbi:hypothetical protein GUITHDRAFT_107941 [Guillardia theta CCMP2712]|uniref:RWP-RK domain-containing protein n=3 Tax=Guillardia theta TaxID=55529 RepID=L1JE15_GUITC|nr:hypothetical protein GUITHDRAFT_107941 [Guillardia theta CCMP2712]EKX46335.1 hypothetical protein GUITHDRAFT_107941 [Guillardia theta CCMP2712]|eukprot:XP_005833315.1 hypothetical protein GUITHDRAFT_107941 [Guillardia theta CCMP2712]
MQNHVVTVKGRTKLARETGIGRVNLDLNALEQLFNYRQEDAAAMLGISMTSLKIACRRLGVSRWPYSRSRQTDVEIDPSVVERRGSNSASPVSQSASSAVSQLPLFDGSASSSRQVEQIHAEVSSPQSLADDDDDDSETAHRPEAEDQSCSSAREEENSEEGMSSIDKQWLDWFIQSDDQSPVFADSCHVPEFGLPQVEFLGY